MSRSFRTLAFVAPLAFILISLISGFWVARANALPATPVAEGTGASLTVIEHADRVT